MNAQIQDTQTIYDMLLAYAGTTAEPVDYSVYYQPEINAARDSFFGALAIFVGGLDQNPTPEEIVKAAVETRTVKLLVFYYTRKAIVDTVMERTAYIAKTRRDKELKTHLLDVITLTQDDDGGIFTPYLADASTQVFTALKAFTRAVENAHLHLVPSGILSPAVKTYVKGDMVAHANHPWKLTEVDEEEVTDPGNFSTTNWTQLPDYIYTDDKIEFIILQPDWLNQNMIPSIDTAIFEAMVSYSMYKWFLTVYPEEAGIYYQEFDRYSKQIISHVNSTNRPLNRRYRLF